MSLVAQYLESLQRFGIKPGLERIRALLHRGGDPQLLYPMILVGGTNGKGSTCEFLARLLQREGFRTGLYTSPHLYRWNERVRVLESGSVGQAWAGTIDDEAFDAALEELLPHLRAIEHEHGQTTEFEVLTALGLCHFARARVDLAVVEVGLGGRWDATNVTEPCLSIVTRVALDHCDRLGLTREAIAADKTHIARAGHTLLTGETTKSVLQVMREVCAERGAKLVAWQKPDDSTAPPVAHNLLHALSSYKADNPWCGTDFQQENAMTALLARLALPGFTAPDAATVETWKVDCQAGVPGRLERVGTRPDTFLDGANNPDGTARLASWLKSQQRPGRRIVLILGILADKDFTSMTADLAPLATVVIATQSSSPRAAPAAHIAAIARRYCPEVYEAVPPMAAVSLAQKLTTEQDLILITGSFYTLAECGLSSSS